MELITYPTASEFLTAARTPLEADEAANNLMYGLALRAMRFPERIQIPYYYAVVHSSGDVRAAALISPPHNLIVSSAGPGPSAPAFRLITDHLRREGWPVPGVLGPNAAALAFAVSWQTVTGDSCRLATHQRVYKLRKVISPPSIGGWMRLAVPDDLELLARWDVDFHQDTLSEEMPSLEDARESVRARVEDRSFYLWVDDGLPVSMAGWTRPTPHGCCIGPVYTPAEFRRKGYATALTAALSRLLLDAGKQFTVLFTDLANPVSNSIYRKIGYRRACEFDLYRFEKPGSG